MNLLYVASGHPLQNADDVLTFDELGINWIDTGYYRDSEKPGDLPFIKRKNPELYELLKSQKNNIFQSDLDNSINGIKNRTWTNNNAKNDWLFDKDFIKHFDVILFNHYVENVERNIGSLAGKHVILKTYGMHGYQNEKKISVLREKFGVKIVRNSPIENQIFKDCYSGHDAIIRSSVVKDENEISGWTGKIKSVCTFSSFFDVPDTMCMRRGEYYKQIKSLLSNINMSLFGILNNNYDNKSNFVSHDYKLNVLKSFRANLVVGTPGSSNTYSFIEAWIMGQPIVCFGEKLWQSNMCEASYLIENGETGFVSNNLLELCEYIKNLITDYDLAKKISKQAREKAVSIFGRKAVCKQWEHFFKSLGVI